VDQHARVIIIDVRDEAQFTRRPSRARCTFLRGSGSPSEGDSKGHHPRLHLKYRRRSSQAAKLAELAGFKTAEFCPLRDWKQKGYETEAGRSADSRNTSCPLLLVPCPTGAQFIDRDAHGRQRQPAAKGDIRGLLDLHAGFAGLVVRLRVRAGDPPQRGRRPQTTRFQLQRQPLGSAVGLTMAR